MEARGAAAGGPELEPRLDDRILALLEQQPAEITFNGLRRALSAHPESLSRALRRLARFGQIERESNRYRIPNLRDHRSARHRPWEPIREPRRALVIETRLPPSEPVAELLGRLAGRWFGRLRWVGTYDRPSEPLLVWSRSDGPGHLLLGIRPGRLRIYAEPPPAEVVGGGRALEAAARELLIHAMDQLAEVGEGWSSITDRTPTSPARVQAN